MLLSNIIAHTTHFLFLGCPSYGDLNIPLTEESGRGAEVRRLALPAAMAAGSASGSSDLVPELAADPRAESLECRRVRLRSSLSFEGGVPLSLGDFSDILAQRLLLCGFSVC